MMEQTDLDALSAALAKATPGEWRTTTLMEWYPDEGIVAGHPATPIAVAEMGNDGEARHSRHGDDAKLICLIKSAAPQMIAEITALREERGRLREALCVVRGSIGDLRKGFAKSVDPARWVEQTIAYIDAALTTRSTDTAAREAAVEAATVERVHEQIAEGGSWRACNGCQESEDGYVSQKYYPYSSLFKCQPGGGCSECGGIGVIWEAPGYWDGFGDEISEPAHIADAGEGDTAARDEGMGDIGLVEAARNLLSLHDADQRTVGYRVDRWECLRANLERLS